ncbi:MAG: DUF4394 domain-containing protein [Pseudomonadota bacterium]
MFALPIRLFAPIALLSGALLSACGGGGGGNDAPAAATLEVIKTGSGTGTVSGSGIDCGSSCTTTSTVGASVTLVATPGSGQLFDGWSGDAASCATNTSCTLTLNSTRVVARASFSVIPTTTVTAVLSGNSMGTVTSNPAGINCTPTAGSDCSEAYRQGGMVTLTATPANANNLFTGWSGNAAGCGTTRTCTLMLTGSTISAVATFQPINRALSVSTSGTGTVTSSPAGINCGADCGENYQQGSMISLTAAPGAGFSFQGWGGTCSGSASCVVTMDADKTVTAAFVTSNVTLTVNKLGNGTVTSSPAGINCGSDCTESYARGATVTLTAAAGATDTFQGWSGGGCSGTGTCTPALNGDVTVTASFSGAAGQTLGELIGLTNANRIVSFSRATPGTFRTSAAITGLNSGEAVTAIDSRPLDGLVYGLTNRSRIVTIDPVTGAATVKSTLARDATDTTAPTFSTLSGAVFGIDFNPVVDRLRIVSDTGQNLRANVDTGAVIADSNLNPGTPAIIDPAYTFNFNGSTGTGLFVIDASTDTLLMQTPPNDGTLVSVGALGVNAGALGGFEIIGSNVDAFAALNVAGGAANGSLYAIDLRSGAATSLGDFAGNEPIISLAAPIAPTPPAAGDLALLTASGKLVTVNRAAPGTQRTSAFITGLTAGDTPVDVDYRPDANRALYLLTNNGGLGSLYTVDPATGAASGRIVLAADATGTYTALSGTAFGIDFNPVVDRLRIISNNGQNLRVNVADGLVTTDTAIANTSAILAAGYTNAFLRTGSTALFTIDASSGSLNRQDPPNDGTQVPATSPLGLSTVNAPIGFDINGGNNEGLLSMTDNGTPKLYSVNLATGVAATTTADTLAGGETVKGLSLRPMNEPQIFALSSSGNLLRFTTTTSNTYVTVGAVSFPAGTTGVTLLGMDFRPRNGDLVALGSDAKLYLINPTTAAATLLSTLAADPNDTTDGNTAFSTTLIATGNQYALDFNPVVDRLRIVSSNNAAAMAANLRVNVDTGAVFTDTAVGRPPFAITGIGFTIAPTPVLYGLDTASDRLFSINTGTPAGRLTQISDLGVDLAEISGFDIIGSSEAYAVSVVNSAVNLYAVNLGAVAPGAGAATLRGVVALPVGASALTAFAASTTGANDLYAITDNSRLLIFDRNSPGTLITNRALTGIGTGESIIGMDFTTAGTLYLVTAGSNSVGRLYTVNLSTGAASVVSFTSNTLPPATVNSFTLQPAASYGVDFRPGTESTTPGSTTNGLLRITSSAKHNLEVNLTTLAVSPIADLNQLTPVITSEAYTNSFAGATSTRLFALDTFNDSLMTQSTTAPTIGQLFDVRALGTTVLNTGGFEVIGGADGYAVAVLQATANTAYSTLYRVDLSGAVTPLALANTTQALSDVGRNVNNTDTRVIINAIAVRFTP